MIKHRIVLASASPRRSQLMEQIGFQPDIVPSQIEEDIKGMGPEETVMELSRKKAEDVAGRMEEGAVVIGADTVVASGDRILGKPSGPEEAFEMLCLLQGKVHQVYTGVTIVVRGKVQKQKTFSERTDVDVYPMTKDEIKRYVESGEPLDKAGAYGIQGRFAAYIQRISGDYSNVVGLPVGRLYQEMKEMAVLEE